MDDPLESIRSASRLGYAGTNSVIDRLIDEGWCTADDLVFGYEAIVSSDLPIALAYFQLPFIVRLPPRKWLSCPSEYGHPYLSFIHQGDATLVLVSYQLWEYRRRYYDEYLRSTGVDEDFRKILVPPAFSWVKSRRALTFGTYEVDLANRLFLETPTVLRRFLPIYAVCSQDPHALVPGRPDKFFLMTKRGRVILAAPPKACVTENKKATPNYAANSTAVRKRIATGRPAAIYEEYLLEAVRQMESGATNLAVVYTVMILDWFANEMIRDGIVRKVDDALKLNSSIAQLVRERLWEPADDKPGSRVRVSIRTKFDTYLPAMGLKISAGSRQAFNDVVELRNRIIHKEQIAAVTREAAEGAIRVGMQILEECMTQRIDSGP